MNMRITFLIVLLFLIANLLIAQERPPLKERPKLQITGIVVDVGTGIPVQYAYILLYRMRDKQQITGTVTDRDGRFLLEPKRPGRYFLTVKFMGFRADTIRNIRIGPGKPLVELGEIPLYEAQLETDAIEVEAEKAPITYRIDKKIINVRGQTTAASGTAVDVLENVPSITVDIEGNVSLRGNQSFLVLIDNKPSILQGSDALQQIPASAIENIEIITNPSAKYDPDGTAGIINIVTKKNKLLGVNGIVNLNLGTDDKYGVDFTFSYRMDGLKVYLGADYNDRNFPGTRTEERRTTVHDTTTFLHSDGGMKRRRTTYSVRGGFDYDLTKRDVLSLGLRYGYHDSRRTLTQNYDQWTSADAERLLYDSYGQAKRWGHFYSVNLDYRHDFDRKGHHIDGSVLIQKRDGNEQNLDELNDALGRLTDGRLATENGPSQPLRFKIDYELPLSESDKFEAGYQSRLEKSEDIIELSVYDSLSGQYQEQPEFGHSVEYKNNIHSLYALYSAERGGLGYQAGLRAEYTDRRINLRGEQQTFELDRVDWYPTLHMSYKFAGGRQVMASYTRRLQRTRGWYLEPFITWIDAYNVRKGNPDLKPEYIDSYELSHQTTFGRSLFSAEVYYRVTHNKIQRVLSVYGENVSLHTLANVGKDYMLGGELMLNLDFFKGWNINLMANLFDYRISGTLYRRSFSRHSFNWNVRFNNTFRLGKFTRLQMNGSYNSPSVSAQGKREGYMIWNAGLRQDLFKRRLSLTLQIRDIFDQAKWEFVSQTPDFYSHIKFKRKAPMVMLQVSYRINNYKKERRRPNGENGMDEEEIF